MGLKKIFENRGKIWEGLKNSIFKKEDIEKVALQRKAICETCDYIDRTGSSCEVPGTQPCCSLCGCCLHLKLRSLSSVCDDNRWPALMDAEKEDALKEKLGYKD